MLSKFVKNSADVSALARKFLTISSVDLYRYLNRSTDCTILAVTFTLPSLYDCAVPGLTEDYDPDDFPSGQAELILTTRCRNYIINHFPEGTHLYMSLECHLSGTVHSHGFIIIPVNRYKIDFGHYAKLWAARLQFSTVKKSTMHNWLLYMLKETHKIFWVTKIEVANTEKVDLSFGQILTIIS